MAESTGLIIRPLGPIVAALRQLYQAPKPTITGLDTNQWPTPLQPIAPMGGPSAEPLAFPFQYGQNLIYTPRPDAEYSAAELRWLATYPLARICIENVKDIVCQTPWRVQLRQKPGETKRQRQKREQNDENIKNVSKLFEYPDGEQCWSDWLRPLLEDMFVIDAACVLLRYTRGKELRELRVIPGDSIVRYIDINGFTPMPPDPAYAQLWEGLPRVNLTTQQLLYRSRNIVRRNTQSSQLYGMSPTEQIAPEIKVGMERLEWVTSYYTKGTVPDGIQVVPPEVGPEKIKEAQLAMASELAGDLAKRHQLRLVQGFSHEGKDQFLFPKAEVLADAFDDMHLRKICFAYGTSPQRLQKMMNRASSEQSDDAAEQEGSRPVISWLKSAIVDTIVQRILGLTDYEVIFNTDKEIDIVKQMTTMVGYVKEGIRSRDEARELIGDDPADDPIAQQLRITTANGTAPLEGTPTPDGSTTAGGKPRPGQQTEATGKPNGAVKPNEKAAHASVGFTAGDIVTARGVYEKGTASIAQRAQFQVGELTPTAQSARNHVARTLSHVFDRCAKNVERFFARVKKTLLDDVIKQIWEQIQKELETVPASVEKEFEQAALSGALEGLVQVDVSNADVFAQVNTLARDWASDRAAELVGMAYDAKGNLVDNPNAEYAISETTREQINEIITEAFEAKETSSREIAQAIEESGVFSEARAEMIARTEISHAQAYGNIDGWQASGIVESVDWLTSQEEGVCEECQAIADAGPYPIDAVPDFPHPNCRCILAVSELKEE